MSVNDTEVDHKNCKEDDSSIIDVDTRDVDDDDDDRSIGFS